MSELRIGVLASGTGSNFEAILKNVQKGFLKSSIQVVISNKALAGVLNIAKINNIPFKFLSKKKLGSNDNYNKQLVNILEKYDVNFIVLAGYLKILDKQIIKKYQNRILNIHPALLPSFGGKGMYGIHIHRAVLEYGCKVSGVTVHLVDEEYDSGAPVIQQCVEVREGDTPEILAQSILKIEHKVFSEAIKLFEDDRIQIVGRYVHILPENLESYKE